MDVLQRFKPGTPRYVLFHAAGAVWGAAALLLCIRGVEYAIVGSLPTLVSLSLGIALGAAFYRFIFLRISTKHINRIGSLQDPLPCIFSFLDWRGYIIMGIMITAGVAMRTAGSAPLSLLAVLYLGMGTPLAISAVRFVREGWISRQANSD
jgi:hypothetical protein